MQDSTAETDMTARAAWLHFVGGLTQGEVARRLGVPPTRAHRYIARAQALGLVQISVTATESGCIALEERLRSRFGLDFCRVAMDVPEPQALPLRALAAAGSVWLRDTLARGDHAVIGIGQGRTLAAVVDALGRTDPPDARFVSLLGGLTRSFAANPYDVIHALAMRTGADAWLMPAPLFADSEEDKRVMRSQAILRGVFNRMAQASLAVIGIGDLHGGFGAVSAMHDGAALMARIRAEGAQAEILGQFLDAQGRILPTPLDARVMAMPLADLAARKVVAIAGGAEKHNAIRATLRSGLLSGLILDETTARVLDSDGEQAA
ncbi:Transcriptional regulator LsrR [Maliponia aquimaris]|uniref:Transcriptional regulator LsrR n=2 Tax=Maliponia aquimaris TaxID=1673631 RepID=A0A238KGT0_9RHOB|nr:Transcriptional regulator LsrR [Maliponia aquimaris]